MPSTLYETLTHLGSIRNLDILQMKKNFVGLAFWVIFVASLSRSIAFALHSRALLTLTLPAAHLLSGPSRLLAAISGFPGMNCVAVVSGTAAFAMSILPRNKITNQEGNKKQMTGQINFHTRTGEVVGCKQETRTVVSGGGGANVGISISSHTETEVNFFLRSEDGVETPYKFRAELPLRDGQKIKVLAAGLIVLAIDNYTTQQRYLAPDQPLTFCGKKPAMKSIGERMGLAFLGFFASWPVLFFGGCFASFASDIPKDGHLGFKLALISSFFLSLIIVITIYKRYVRRAHERIARWDAVQSQIDEAVKLHLG